MGTRATDVVLDIASAHRAKVGSANHRIPPFEEPFTAKVRVLVDGVNVRLYAATTLLSAEIGLAAPVTLALGRPDTYIIGASHRIGRIGDTEVSAGEEFIEEARSLVDRGDIRAAIEALAVTADEQLLLALNRSMLTILATNAESATSRIQAAIELLRSIGSQPQKEGVRTLPSIEAIPDAAVAGLGRWAISDDVEREEALAAASSPDLSALAAFLETWADALRTALPRLDQSDPGAAAIWGSLAETAAEAQLELRRRDK